MNRSGVATIKTLSGLGLAPLASGAAPARLKLFNWGDNPSTQGNFVVNETTLAAIAANQRAAGFDKVALDFEHNTVPGTPEYNRTQEPRPVAGFGVVEVVRGEGLYLNTIDWRKPDARAEYVDLSPTVGTNSSGEVTFVHSVALCRNGSVFDLTIETASALSALLGKQHQPQENKMQLTLAALAAMVGLAETATQEDVKAQFAKLNALSERLNAVEALKLTTLTAVPGNVTQLEGRIAELEKGAKADADMAKANLVTLFATNGKVPLNAEGKAYTGEELQKLDVVTLKVLHANTPPTVPLRSAPQGRANAGTATVDKVTALNAAVAKYRKDHGCDHDTAFAQLRVMNPELFTA